MISKVAYVMFAIFCLFSFSLETVKTSESPTRTYQFIYDSGQGNVFGWNISAPIYASRGSPITLNLDFHVYPTGGMDFAFLRLEVTATLDNEAQIQIYYSTLLSGQYSPGTDQTFTPMISVPSNAKLGSVLNVSVYTDLNKWFLFPTEIRDMNYDDLESSYADAQSQISALNQQISDLDTQIADAQSQISALNQQVINLNVQITNADNQISALNRQVSDLETQINNLTQELGTWPQQKDALNQQIASLTSEKSALNGQISSLNQQVSDLTSEKSALNGQISSLNQQVAALNSQVANLQNQGMLANSIYLIVAVAAVAAIAIGAAVYISYGKRKLGRQFPMSLFCTVNRGYPLAHARP